MEQKKTEKAVKSAYRKLSLKYHPDRNLKAESNVKAEAAIIFEKVQKAHEVLTDEKKYQLFIQYGTADGNTRNMEVSIGLPKYLMNKRNHNLILIAYLLVFCILVPILVGQWYLKSTKFGDKLILNDTYGIFTLWLEKGITLEHFPEVLSLAAEYRSTPNFSKEDESLLLQLQTEMRQDSQMSKDYHFKTKQRMQMEKFPGCARANVLIHVYLNRHMDRLSRPLYDALQDILVKSQLLIPVMAETIGYTRFTPLMKMQSKFQQYMTQGLWITGIPTQQLPHVTPEDAARSVGVSRDFEKILESKENRIVLEEDMDDYEKNDCESVVPYFPKIKIDVEIGCVKAEGKDGTLTFHESIHEGDILTAVIKIKREHILGKVYSPYLPYSKEESWQVYFTQEKNKNALTSISLTGHTEVIQDKIVFPSKGFIEPGKHIFEFHITSNDYLGFDKIVKKEITLKKFKEDLIEPLHIEDQNLDNTLSLFEEAFGKVEESEDSDFLDSDEELERKKGDKPIARKKNKKSKNDSLVASDDDLSDTEYEADPEPKKTK